MLGASLLTHSDTAIPHTKWNARYDCQWSVPTEHIDAVLPATASNRNRNRNRTPSPPPFCLIPLAWPYSAVISSLAVGTI